MHDTGLVETAAAPSTGKSKKAKTDVVRIPLPGDGRKILACAIATAEALQGRNAFFRRGNIVLYPDPSGSPEMLPVTTAMFRSIIEHHVEYYKVKHDPTNDEHTEVTRSLNKSDAESILECPDFRSRLPELKRVHPCPLYARKPDGRIVLLEPGYDKETCIYTFKTQNA